MYNLNMYAVNLKKTFLYNLLRSSYLKILIILANQSIFLIIL